MNRGAALLAQQLAERGNQSKLASALGVDQGYLSRIARGLRVPGLVTRRILERECKIPMQFWDEPEKPVRGRTPDDPPASDRVPTLPPTDESKAS